MKTIDLSKDYNLEIVSTELGQFPKALKERIERTLKENLRGLYYKSENLGDYNEEDILVNRLNSSFDYQVNEILKEYFQYFKNEPDDITIIIN